MRFISKAERYSTYAGKKKISFIKGRFETTNKKIIALLEKHPMYGKNFFGVKPEEPQPPETTETPEETQSPETTETL